MSRKVAKKVIYSVETYKPIYTALHMYAENNLNGLLIGTKKIVLALAKNWWHGLASKIFSNLMDICGIRGCLEN
jgi:hypothetical protein